MTKIDDLRKSGKKTAAFSLKDLLDPDMKLITSEERDVLIEVLNDPHRYTATALAEVICTWDVPKARGGGKFSVSNSTIRNWRRANGVASPRAVGGPR